MKSPQTPSHSGRFAPGKVGGIISTFDGSGFWDDAYRRARSSGLNRAQARVLANAEMNGETHYDPEAVRSRLEALAVLESVQEAGVGKDVEMPDDAELVTVAPSRGPPNRTDPPDSKRPGVPPANAAEAPGSLRSWVVESRRAQGLPDTVTDPEALGAATRLMGGS